MRDEAPAPLEKAAYHGGLHLLALAVTALAFAAVLLGGYTKSKEAGLTIADPVTFAWMPEWLATENINAEYSHRIVAFLLACATAVLAGVALAKERRPAVRKLAVWAVALVVAQAVLGALTVSYFARASTSVPHAILGQLFLCVAASIAVTTSRGWLDPERRQVVDAGGSSMRRLAMGAVIMLVIQLILGAALRHDNKGAALRGGQEHVFIMHLLAHILGAFGVLFFSGRVMARVFRAHRDIRELMLATYAVMMLLALQLALGIGAAVLKVWTSGTYDEANAPPAFRVAVATLHQAGGALLLLLSVVTMLYAYRLVVPRPDSAPSGESLGAARASA